MHFGDDEDEAAIPCAVCKKDLDSDSVDGIDLEIGFCCGDCGPHVQAANLLMYPEE